MAGSNEAELSIVGEAGDVINDIKKIVREMKALVQVSADVIKGTTKGGKAGKKMGKQFFRGFADAKAGADLLIKALNVIISKQKEMNASKDDTNLSLDRSFRKLGTQAGIQSTDFLAERVGTKAVKFALNIEQTAAGAQELISQGVKRKDVLSVESNVLDAVLQTAVATGDVDKIGELSGAIVGFLKEQGKDITKSNVQKLGLDVFDLFQSEVLQSRDLPQLGRIAGQLSKAGLSQREQLSLFTLAKESAGGSAEVAKTSVKKLISTIQTASSLHSKGDQPWDFFGRNDAKAETPILRPPHAKS